LEGGEQLSNINPREQHFSLVSLFFPLILNPTPRAQCRKAHAFFMLLSPPLKALLLWPAPLTPEDLGARLQIPFAAHPSGFPFLDLSFSVIWRFSAAFPRSVFPPYRAGSH